MCTSSFFLFGNWSSQKGLVIAHVPGAIAHEIHYTSVTMARIVHNIGCLWSLVGDPSIDNFRSGSFAWELSRSIFRLGILAWDRSFGNFRLGSFAWNFRLGTFAWKFSFGIYGLGTFARERSLGELGSWGWGNWAHQAGGTAGQILGGLWGQCLFAWSLRRRVRTLLSKPG